jgi:hypothetical protein
MLRGGVGVASDLAYSFTSFLSPSPRCGVSSFRRGAGHWGQRQIGSDDIDLYGPKKDSVR